MVSHANKHQSGRPARSWPGVWPAGRALSRIRGLEALVEQHVAPHSATDFGAPE